MGTHKVDLKFVKLASLSEGNLGSILIYRSILCLLSCLSDTLHFRKRFCDSVLRLSQMEYHSDLRLTFVIILSQVGKRCIS